MQTLFFYLYYCIVVSIDEYLYSQYKHKSTTDYNIYYQYAYCDIVILLLYIDDLKQSKILSYFIAKFKLQLSRVFAMMDLGSICKFLGI